MKNKIIDLSLSIEEGMITYPSTSHIQFESSIIGRLEIEGRETRKLIMGSHCGTHIDAPKHFLKGGNSVIDFEVNDLVGNALLIDLGELKPGSLISLKDFSKQFNQYEKITRVVFRTNWSRFWNTSQYYKDWPYFDKESIEFLIEKKIKLIGIDFPSPDCQYYGNNCDLDSPNHKLIFKANIILTEYLTNLEQLDNGLIFLMVHPLKLVDFDGAPARVTAFNL